MTKSTPQLIQPQLPFDEVHPDFIILSKNARDITGEQFGRLTVLGPVGKAPHGHILWLCRCDCGNVVTPHSGTLRSKQTRSCGCLCMESRVASHTTHGGSNHPLFSTWQHIMKRCFSPVNPAYKNYGDRGISVWDEWQRSPQQFCDYISKLEHCSEKGYSLDRINNDGNYEPGNVRYATRAKQARNLRKNTLVTHNGVTKCVSEWAHDAGIDSGTLFGRLRRDWPMDKALAQPVNPKCWKHTKPNP